LTILRSSESVRKRICITSEPASLTILHSSESIL
jgi:hypothetical protein